jgi:hypothetical protein
VEIAQRGQKLRTMASYAHNRILRKQCGTTIHTVRKIEFQTRSSAESHCFASSWWQGMSSPTLVLRAVALPVVREMLISIAFPGTGSLPDLGRLKNMNFIVVSWGASASAGPSPISRPSSFPRNEQESLPSCARIANLRQVLG